MNSGNCPSFLAVDLLYGDDVGIENVRILGELLIISITASHRARPVISIEPLHIPRGDLQAAVGQVTVVAMPGRATHGLVKRAKSGDFRVQDDHGGTVHEHVPAADEVSLTQAALGVYGPTPVYGRVDMVRDADGVPCIMELELIEPELWLRLHPPAAEAFADGIVAALA